MALLLICHCAINIPSTEIEVDLGFMSWSQCHPKTNYSLLMELLWWLEFRFKPLETTVICDLSLEKDNGFNKWQFLCSTQGNVGQLICFSRDHSEIPSISRHWLRSLQIGFSNEKIFFVNIVKLLLLSNGQSLCDHLMRYMRYWI